MSKKLIVPEGIDIGGNGCVCPKCKERFWLTTNKCPNCGLDFNSEEFTRITQKTQTQESQS